MLLKWFWKVNSSIFTARGSKYKVQRSFIAVGLSTDQQHKTLTTKILDWEKFALQTVNECFSIQERF